MSRWVFLLGDDAYQNRERMTTPFFRTVFRSIQDGFNYRPSQCGTKAEQVFRFFGLQLDSLLKTLLRLSQLHDRVTFS